jgi:hypothetical protein
MFNALSFQNVGNFWQVVQMINLLIYGAIIQMS